MPADDYFHAKPKAAIANRAQIKSSEPTGCASMPATMRSAHSVSNSKSIFIITFSNSGTSGPYLDCL